MLLVEEFSDWWNELELDLPLLLAGVDHEFTIELREESTLTGMLAGCWSRLLVKPKWNVLCSKCFVTQKDVS